MSRIGDHVIDLMERGEWPLGPEQDGPDICDENYRLSDPSAAHEYIRILQRKYPLGFGTFRAPEQIQELSRARGVALVADMRKLVGK